MRVVPRAPGAAGAEPDGAEGVYARKALLGGTKHDLPGAAEGLELLALEVGDRLPLFAVSSTTGTGLDELKRALFAALDVIRVYTKPPGKPADRTKPFILPRGSAIEDLADAIHHDLRAKLRYAALWGASGKFSGQRVGREHVLEDEDVVELYER
jgi:ribosome-interacting GTPase 1